MKSVLFPDKLPVFLAESLFYNFVRIQHNGKWPIIAQRNLHICSENTMFHDRNSLLAVGNHVFIQSLCGFGCSGSNKAGAVALPAVEVHLSDVDAREAFRHVSYAGMACFARFTGLGFEGYRQAVLALKDRLNAS